MMLIMLLFVSTASLAQDRNAQQIRHLLHVQTEAWNKGDLSGFMQTYLHSDSLMFIGKSGIHWGWSETLNNYKKGYPDTTAMGKLSFDIIRMKELSPKYYYVVAKWLLKRTAGDLAGYTDLLIENSKGKWYIIADHSS
jgi:hypothetical protein